MSQDEAVLLERDGAVAVVSFNRPDKLNAVGGGTLDRLRELEDIIMGESGIRAVVLTGKGRAFCAGADLSGGPEAQSDPVNMRERFPIRHDGGWPVGWFGFNLRLPVVCAVNGPAVGYGAEVMATCDMRVAAESARIGWVFARRGLVTDMGVGPIVLPRLVGLSQAARLLYSGEIVGSAEALRIGLVDEVVPDDQCLGRALEVARHLAAGAPMSVASHKRQLLDTLRRDPHEIYFENLDDFETTRGSEDFKEGVRSFLEKRDPVWTGR